MSEYEIYIDASVDVPADVLNDGNVHIVPMHYTADGAERVMERPLNDGEMKAYYDEMRAGVVMKTSQITPFHYEEAFRDDIEADKGIIYLSLSSGLSNTYTSALTARDTILDEHPDAKIEIVDTLGATGGMGLLLILAVRNREKGMSLEENAAFLRDHALDVVFWFVVDDLSFLRRGGRISAASAIAGTMLNLKPILKITDEGTLTGVSKQRGIAKALKYMASLYEKSHEQTIADDVIICHADDIERAEKIRDMILDINPNARARITSLSPIIGAHTGPGMTCICYLGNRNIV
ncbi:DegV family protein [[Clostridium] aminophilum]|uniref:DegV family protein n=1 Tax=[Clostridium] aminophilum TaxID=1526 RepID=UPI003F9526C4